jgi:transposase
MNPTRVLPNHADQGVLFSESFVGDRLHDNHESFVFRELMRKLDLKILHDAYGNEGGHMFSPDDIFAVVAYGYMKGFCSSYQLADAVEHRLDFIMLAGGHAIKRRTLSDFRARHRESIAKIFLQTVEMANEVGLIDFAKIFALDGSKIRSNANRDQRKSREEWQEEREKLRQTVEDFMDRWEKTDTEEEEREAQEAERMAQIRERIAALPKQKPVTKEETSGGDSTQSNPEKPASTIDDASDAISTIDKIERIDHVLEENPKLESINIVDPESRLMKFGAGVEEGFNMQAVSHNGVLVALDITQDENDQHQLENMTEQLLKNIGFEDKIKQSTSIEQPVIRFTADAGYNAGRNLAYLDSRPEVDPYISMHQRDDKKSAYHRKHFKYDETPDEYQCPQGKILESLVDKNHHGAKVTIYAAKLTDCIHCPVRAQCVTNKDDIRRGYRTIEDDAFAVHRHAMRTKMQIESNKAIYRQRAGEIEPRFGWKKRITLPQLRMRGKSGAKTEASLSSIAYNLRQLLKRAPSDWVWA